MLHVVITVLISTHFNRPILTAISARLVFWSVTNRHWM